MSIERPKTQKEMIGQLWFVVIGSNGDGVVAMIRDALGRIKKIEEAVPTFWTREEHAEAMKDHLAWEDKHRMRENQAESETEAALAKAQMESERKFNRWIQLGMLVAAVALVLVPILVK